MLRHVIIIPLLTLSAAKTGAALNAPPVGAFLDVHCYECHDSEVKKGDLDLTALKFDLTDAKAFATWVKVHDRVRDGEMPPKKMVQPEI